MKITERIAQELGVNTRQEDLYAPYRPKRRTRAQIAREAGLEPVLDSLLQDPSRAPDSVASGYLNPDAGFAYPAAVLDGVRQIFLERVAEQADLVTFGELNPDKWDRSPNILSDRRQS
jgi:protein Tex